MELAQRFEQLWDAAVDPPDLMQFIRRNAIASSMELLTIVRIDQQRRWRSAVPWSVEDYLEKLPQLLALSTAGGSDTRQQLLMGEYLARRASALPLEMEEVRSRFPEVVDSFRQQVLDAQVAAEARHLLKGFARLQRMHSACRFRWSSSGMLMPSLITKPCLSA